MKRQFVTARVICDKNEQLDLHISCGEYEKIYHSVGCNREELESFANKINRNQVSLLHMEEILEDMLM